MKTHVLLDVILTMAPYILLDKPSPHSLGVLAGREGLQVTWQWQVVVTGGMDVDRENVLPTLTPLTVLTRVTSDLCY